MDKLNAISLFSSAGIGELNLHSGNINFVAANELLKKRADCYRFFYPGTKMFQGDITDDKLKNELLLFAKKMNVRVLLATPPCQGLSSIGKNKHQEHFLNDRRNFLILEVFDFIDNLDLDYILIENVPRFLEMYFPYQNDVILLKDILEKKYKKNYIINITVLNAKDYGIAQSRPRAIIKMYKKHLKLYPFRLIFKLLLDDRLEKKLYHFEMEAIIVFIQKIDILSYENLVSKILETRQLADVEKFDILKRNEVSFVKIVYEWEYYVSKILKKSGVIIVDEGMRVVKLFHEQTRKNSLSSPTARNASNGCFKLNPELISYISNLLAEFRFDEIPISLNDPRSLTDDSVKEIYSFYPKLLLIEIDEIIDEQQMKILELPKQIELFSTNKNNETSHLFEKVLVDGFNQFYNVIAIHHSGAGKTDIECLHQKVHTEEKFTVEAKSTSNKLMQISSGRLKHHRNLVGAAYTIVVTPNFAPSVKYDIDGQDIVILKASTLSEFLYQHLANGIREIDYNDVYEVVKGYMGKDISARISEITLTKFGWSSNTNTFKNP